VAIGVVDGLEVVEVEHDDAERPLARSGARDLLAQALVARAMVEQPGEAVRARLLAQRVALAGGVEGERRHRREPLDLGDLGRAERLLLADPVDVERGDDAVRDQQGHGCERLGLHLGALDDRGDRILVGALDVARAAVGDDPAGDALTDREGVRHHLGGVLPEREHRNEHLGGAIDLVDRQLVEVEQLAHVMRDPPERVGQGIGGQDACGRVDQRLQCGCVSVTGAGRDGILLRIVRPPARLEPRHSRAGFVS